MLLPQVMTDDANGAVGDCPISTQIQLTPHALGGNFVDILAISSSPTHGYLLLQIENEKA